MKIQERYACAVTSSNLDVDPNTTFSDSDVIGAYGLAGKEHPLATALERLFSGDNKGAKEVTEILSQMAWRQARAMKVKLTLIEAMVMAQACLAWHRNGTCKVCGGLGKMLIPNTKTLGEIVCDACHGEGKIPFEQQFPQERRELARWMLSEMEREQSRAGPAAMKKLAAAFPF